MDTLGERHFLRVPELDVHWVEMGRGRPLVLLHGLSDSHRTWRRLGPLLSARRRVLMLDLPGHGLSGRPDASYELGWYARVVGSWLDALGLEGVDVIGHSFGGGVAQSLLLESRRSVGRLGLVASGGLGAEVSLGLRLLSLPGIVERFGQPFVGPMTRVAMLSAFGVFPADDVDWLSWANAMPGTAKALSRTVRGVIDWRGQRRQFFDHARDIAALPPTALYWGDRDEVIPASHGVAMESSVDGVTLTLFEGCGHFLHHQRPVELAEALGRFLEAAPGAAPRLRSSPASPPRPRRASWWRCAWGAITRCFHRRR